MMSKFFDSFWVLCQVKIWFSYAKIIIVKNPMSTASSHYYFSMHDFDPSGINFCTGELSVQIAS